MNEIIFLIEEDPEGGYTSRALDYSIFTEADDIPELKMNIKEAVDTHFPEGEAPKIIRLHYVKEEILSNA